MKKTVLLLTLALLAACSGPEQRLQFRDGEFRIAQFTDIHLGWGTLTYDDFAGLVDSVVESESPDLIVLTGDIITGADDLAHAERSWQQLCSILESTGRPYAICLGNHDAESTQDITADHIFSWIGKYGPGCVNADGAAGIHGHGNKALPVYGSDGRPAAVIYAIDSNDYPQDQSYSTYDWIHLDQVQWYMDESEAFTAANGGTPLPSLAYFHICVPEFETVAQDPEHFGSYAEPTCPADINSGFFAAAFTMHDIMGMFVGHDHTNDFCGIHKDIALCYGRQSGINGNSEPTPMGARIVLLKEGRRAFDTWTRTLSDKGPVWNYPTGFSESDLVDPLLSAAVEVSGNGVAYRYYQADGKVRSFDEILRPELLADEGVMANFDITKAPAEDFFGYSFESWFLAEETDIYRFTLTSDDGSELLIDGRMVVDNGGSHGTQIRQSRIALAKGYHKLTLNYFENYMGQTLDLKVMSRTIDNQPVPDRLLFTE